MFEDKPADLYERASQLYASDTVEAYLLGYNAALAEALVRIDDIDATLGDVRKWALEDFANIKTAIARARARDCSGG